MYTGIHYYTYIKRGEEWKKYNDSRVTVETKSAIEEAAKKAYMYFYQLSSS